jgi:DNA-binding beta-propeller fold protein YncE
MNSTRRPTIRSNANRAVGILFAAALFATIGFFASSVAAQEAAPSGTIETFPAGENPWGLAFDGENIWVTNAIISGGTVTKLRASDGALLGTFPVNGASAAGITFDGENIWVASTLSSTVTKLRASDGAYLGGLIIAQDPLGITFDGANVWVAHRTTRDEGSVTKILSSDMHVLGVFPAGPKPRNLTFDGANIWVVNEFAESLTKIRASDGTLLGTFQHGRRLQVTRQ